jgi:hypothetical protein
MVHLIVGHGEVGKAIHKVLGKALWIDRNGGTWKKEKVDAIHICIPWSRSFINDVYSYKLYAPLVIVHSTVPVGVCDMLEVVHSPIRGIHPKLEKGIRTFVKYFGGKNAQWGAEIFKRLGIKTVIFREAKTTEALKLWDTTMYGIMILIEKEIYKWCKENNLNYEEVYRQANKDYNEGYTKLGKSEVVRPYLKQYDGKIGGHCIIPNAKLLGKTYLAETLLKKNGEW